MGLNNCTHTILRAREGNRREQRAGKVFSAEGGATGSSAEPMKEADGERPAGAGGRRCR
jgi:hypothetical protein